MDERFVSLVRAIAWELLQLGYVPVMDKHGYITHKDREPLRLVAEDTWRAMIDIQSGAEP